MNPADVGEINLKLWQGGCQTTRATDFGKVFSEILWKLKSFSRPSFKKNIFFNFSLRTSDRSAIYFVCH